MKIAVFAYSRRGCDTARQILTCFSGDEIRAFTMEKFIGPGFEVKDGACCGRMFSWADALVFVGACGIAVRKIAPYVHDKTTDPAVLCVDELGRFVIPLLSGHIGGANALAARLAACIDATAVITTATDINRRFSADAWAAENGFFIDNRRTAKAVSAAILERDIPMLCRLPVGASLPAGTFPGEAGDIGIYLGWGTERPFVQTLALIPQVLHLGIGCRKGTDSRAIAEAVSQVLEANAIDPRAVKCAASVDLKAGEAGLLEFCGQMGLPIRFYSPEKLTALAGDFSHSEFVKQVAGVDCVCERSAMMGADRLIVKKTAINGVTVAIAAERCEVCFE